MVGSLVSRLPVCLYLILLTTSAIHQIFFLLELPSSKSDFFLW